MKKSLLLITFILVVYSVSGQQVPRKALATDLLKQKTGTAVTNATAALRLSNSLTEDWLPTSVWQNNSKTEFTYGTNSEVETTSRWNTSTLVWDLFSKSEYTFDANGNTTLILDYSRAGSLWINSSKTEMSYDANGNEIQYTRSTWNGADWLGQSKVEYTYDTGNNLILEVSSTYTSSWVKISKTEHLYTGGKNTQDLSYTSDVSLPSPVWVNNQKTDYVYNGGGNVILETNWNWDITLPIPDWVYSDKTEIVYDGAGNMNILTLYDWDKTLPIPDWVASIKAEYIFDVNKNITQYTLFMWADPAWVGYSKSEITYTTNKSVTLTYSWNMLTSLWDVKKRFTDNYSDVTAVEKHNENGIKVYPNSAGGNIIIENSEVSGRSTVQIFDLSGRKVLDQKLSGGREVVSTDGFKNGIYLYRITVNGKSASGKLMIK